MTELGLILFGALLVNNFVLAQFLGLCPFMGITRSFDTAFATGLATTFVLTLAAVTSHTVYHYLLVPLNLTYLNIIVFIIVIAGLVQVIQLYLKATSPVLHQVLGVYLPLITSNCAVLGVPCWPSAKSSPCWPPLSSLWAPPQALPWSWCCSVRCGNSLLSQTCLRPLRGHR